MRNDNRQNNKGRNQNGFTIVEVCLVTVMVAVLAITLYFMLSNGLKVWQLFMQETPRLDMHLFFEKADEELKSSFYTAGIEFTGTSTGLIFPARVSMPAQPGAGFTRSMAKIEYFFDTEEKTLFKKQADYAQSFSLKDPAPRAVIDNIEEVSFKYYFFDDQNNTFFWSDSWPPQQAKDKKLKNPQAVRINVSFLEDTYLKQRTRTIFMPAGGMLE
ncbi:MAG: type II secretion system protein GspJ [Candidatus Omnitrophica bacterium]|nr:type II secretion system protein GspJ [Candidatus Omnitrophota bacterium]